jgi:hypothetical protein
VDSLKTVVTEEWNEAGILGMAGVPVVPGSRGHVSVEAELAIRDQHRQRSHLSAGRFSLYPMTLGSSPLQSGALRLCQRFRQPDMGLGPGIPAWSSDLARLILP